jgi:Alpha/beta hydrolase domain
VSGPVTGGTGIGGLVTTTFSFPSVGYVSDEYFLQGNATAFAPTATLTSDGRWKVHPAGTASYKTRMVVYRPENSAKFDGTVFVEWINVSSGLDYPPDWMFVHSEIIRMGAAWVGIDAQALGVDGGQSLEGPVATGLTESDPARYGSLHVPPGDAYSYSIFTQGGLAALGRAAGVNPLGSLKAQRVIAMGQSQSAARMVTYIDAVQPIAGVYDGFLVHSRGATPAALGYVGPGTSSGPAGQASGMPAEVKIRTDLHVPVITLETETDVEHFGFLPATQPDSKYFRLWEVAGTAHADAYDSGVGFNDVGNGEAEAALLNPAQIDNRDLKCALPINSGLNFAVAESAVWHLDQWLRRGVAPPSAPRFTITGGPTPRIARDGHGNAEGGIRTPVVDVPIATYTGNPNSPGVNCELEGSTVLFSATTLESLYPTHADYVAKFDRATQRAVNAGFVLPWEGQNLEHAAASLPIGG